MAPSRLGPAGCCAPDRPRLRPRPRRRRTRDRRVVGLRPLAEQRDLFRLRELRAGDRWAARRRGETRLDGFSRRTGQLAPPERAANAVQDLRAGSVPISLMAGFALRRAAPTAHGTCRRSRVPENRGTGSSPTPAARRGSGPRRARAARARGWPSLSGADRASAAAPRSPERQALAHAPWASDGARTRARASGASAWAAGCAPGRRSRSGRRRSRRWAGCSAFSTPMSGGVSTAPIGPG